MQGKCPSSCRITRSTCQELYAQRQFWSRLGLPDAFKPCTPGTKLNFSEPLLHRKGVLSRERWLATTFPHPLSKAPEKLLSAGVRLASSLARLALLTGAEFGLWRGLGGAEFFSSPLFNLSLWDCPASTEEPKCSQSR